MELVISSVNHLQKHGSEEVENSAITKHESKEWTQKRQVRMQITSLSGVFFVGFHKITSLYTGRFL